MALTHEEIANMAGTSRETVTRLLNQFRRDQWITIKGTSLTIVKPDQLEKLTAYARFPFADLPLLRFAATTACDGILYNRKALVPKNRSSVCVPASLRVHRPLIQSLSRACFKNGFVKGHDFSRAEKAQ